MLIDGFGIRNYRSFGPEPQHFGPLNKVSLCIGQNNSGKSNILKFAYEHLGPLVKLANQGQNRYKMFDGLDKSLLAADGPSEFAIGLSIGGNSYQQWFQEIGQTLHRNSKDALSKLTTSQILTEDSDLVWFWHELTGGYVTPSTRQQTAHLQSECLSPSEWQNLWRSLTNQSGGSIKEHWVPQTLARIAPSVNIEAELIPAIREVRKGDSDHFDFGGAGLIERLAQYQNPGYQDQKKKEEFDKINDFLCHVTGSGTARIEIPADRDTILAHLEGRVLPLEALGTGIHEVVILAAAATICSNKLVCIEEPEIHLHPTLQRKLLRYLRQNTSNQYLIATHSAHLLDEPETSVIHVQMKGGASIARNASTAKEKSEICIDLGYRPSDLLQANSIIWVEGPSDRIYLRHWISKVAPDVIEGIHYSIMFYGGRLLCHLTADDPEVDEFISLRRLNRQISILIDSDRSAKGKRLNDTKIRVRQEVEEGPGLAWVTKGREIENYVPSDVLEEAIKSVHPSARSVLHKGTYARVLRYKDRRGKACIADKVKVARQVVAANPTLDILDLKKQLKALVRFIRAANE